MKERPEDIARKILEGLSAPPETFIYEGYAHVVEQSLWLPKDFHNPATRKAPIQIEAYADPSEPHGSDTPHVASQFPDPTHGARVVVRSGKWEKYVPDIERGFGLKRNEGRHADVYLDHEPVGILRCHPRMETSEAPKAAAAWIGTICSLVEEREPTDAELAALQKRRLYKPENTGFYFVRAKIVRPRGRFMRWLTTQF